MLPLPLIPSVFEDEDLRQVSNDDFAGAKAVEEGEEMEEEEEEKKEQEKAVLLSQTSAEKKAGARGRGAYL